MIGSVLPIPAAEETQMPDPNKLLGAHIHTFHKEPLLGVLDLETEKGFIEVAINRAVAELLIERLQAFLGGRKSRPGDGP
jgi:hypothetical protein